MFKLYDNVISSRDIENVPKGVGGDSSADGELLIVLFPFLSVKL